ncbi:hypothetical protein PF005_g708 [Phytophthora fragariae]|uniref:Uncharacterized protein n=1 Tax=Phytophthora fragariae TaxID=53985 RepID=A0A6A4EY78_9STRA|nr:hypothetical protein PF003_g8378 [Phytophthora fragariae]KAE9141315.1 hypothetical protein PF007_g282 [Phytophthora fragariae]KAE9155504.1 hypothetical protein PF006_g560 [Phytophthora fragariae]KAE9237300.1 hypothetical protein PF005_g708 [Phytophthora fragariae]KAE9258518.1 hypothetical protein PF002_g25 [Phytophthora fragariae]
MGPVNRDLPDDVFYESSSSSPQPVGGDTHRRKKSDVAEAIREFGNQAWREALATRKQDTEDRKVRFLEEKESRRMQYMRQRLQREERTPALQDCAFVSDRLRSLYAQQENESNRRIRDDIEDEITTLKAKKQWLADTL